MTGVFNSDQTALYEAKEVTFGTPDATATLNPVRMTQESLKRDSEFTESAELTPDAQIADHIRVNVTGSGTIGFELSHGSFDRLIASVFRQEAFTPVGNVLTLTGDGVADLDFTASDNSVNRDSGSFITDGWEIGMRASVVGSSSNDGAYVVKSVAALKLVMEGTSIVDEANVAATLRSGALLTATTISWVASDNSVNDSGNGFVDAGFVAGQWFTGDGTADNDLLFKIMSVAAGKMILAHAVVTDESAGASMTLTTERYVENGVRLPSHTFERRYLEATTDAEKFAARFPGTALNTMSLTVATGAVVGGEFGVVPKTEEDGGGATFGAGDAAATTTRVLDAVGGVTAVFENGAAFKVTNFALEISNNVEGLTEVGELGSVCNAAGKFQASGTITIYYRDRALFNKYLGNTETSFAIIFTDSAGNRDVLDIPRAVLTDGARGPGGTNTRIQATFSFSTAKDTVEGKTARWVTIDAA